MKIFHRETLISGGGGEYGLLPRQSVPKIESANSAPSIKLKISVTSEPVQENIGIMERLNELARVMAYFHSSF